jgi:hypothetical protein
MSRPLRVVNDLGILFEKALYSPIRIAPLRVYGGDHLGFYEIEYLTANFYYLIYSAYMFICGYIIRVK